MVALMAKPKKMREEFKLRRARLEQEFQKDRQGASKSSCLHPKPCDKQECKTLSSEQTEEGVVANKAVVNQTKNSSKAVISAMPNLSRILNC